MTKVTKDEILQAAVHLFNHSGYHATSMQDIAHTVGIKKPSLYHHFESKEAILLEILETGMAQLIAEIEAIVDSDEPPDQKLQHAIQSHARIIAANPEGAAVFMREDRGLGEVYLEHYLTRRDRFEELMRQIVQAGVEQGVFRQTDVTIAVKAVLGMVNWMTRWYRPEGRLSAEEIATFFSRLVLQGLMKP
jgi:AcrR family transcriptional regulator